MRKLLGLGLLSLALSACYKLPYPQIPRFMLLQDRFSSSVHIEKPHEIAVWTTAVVYPDSVPWQSVPDTSVARLVLFKNGEEVLSAEGASEQHHRFMDGHLWSDRWDGNRTAVYCDGVEVFSFPSEEVFLGFLNKDGHVHTLGQRPGGEGLCYRIDGIEVFSSDVGTIVGAFNERAWPGGALTDDDTGVYYVYRIPVKTYGKLDWEYRVMRGSETVRIILAGTAIATYDIRVMKGKVYSLRRRESGDLVLAEDDLEEKIPEFTMEAICSCIMYPLDGRMVIKGYSWIKQAENYMAWLRDKDGIMHNLLSPRPFAEWQPVGISFSAIDMEGDRVGSLWIAGEEQEPPTGEYTLTSPLCMISGDGLFAAALTGVDGRSHLIMVGQSDFQMSFNGYFCSIHIE